MSDRLRELLRQRALLQEHLAWLDREIDAAAGKPASPAGLAAPAPSVAVSSAPVALPAPASSPAPALPAAAIPRIIAGIATPRIEAAPISDAAFERYRVEPRTVQQDVRKGCFLYFAAAFVLLGLGVTVLYYAISSR